MALKIYSSLSKELKVKVRELRVLVPTFGEVTGEKLARGCAFQLVEIFHFVEIQFPFCLYFQNWLEFLNLIFQL